MNEGPTILDCAKMAFDVYSDSGSIDSWTRFGPACFGDDGFYATTYRRKGDNSAVIAVRGTQEVQDMLEDAFMFPTMSNNDHSRHAMMRLVIAYLRGERSPGALDVVPGLVHFLATRRGVVKAAKKWGNQIPPGQANNGLRYVRTVLEQCENEGLRIVAFAGHSLGGALAQYLSEQTGAGGKIGSATEVPCTAFNAPYMGSMRGMRKGKGGGILIVNCRLDPLSMATRFAGNTTHATHGLIELSMRKPRMPVPYVPEQPTPKEANPFIKWLGTAAGHYHSMKNMVELIADDQIGRERVRVKFGMPSEARV